MIATKVKDMAYNSDSIKVLSDIEHIRLRLGMYIGEPDNPMHLLTEVIDNAIDEAQSGFSDRTVISVDTESNRYAVQDYGRGIPHGKKKLDDGSEIEIVELLCTKSNSGGKFDEKSYTVSAGLHGLGLTLVNALSSSLYICSIRDGKQVELYANDSAVTSLLYTDVPKEYNNGTLVSFAPNHAYFKSSVIPLNEIKERCRILNAFGYKTELVIDNTAEEFPSQDLFSLLPDCEKSYNKAKFESVIDNEKVIVALNYTNGTKYSCAGYTNLIHNKVGGTHVRVLRKTICEAWQVLYKKFKDNTNVELLYEDCLIGLDSLVAVFLKEISFSSQTKEKLTVPADSLSSLFDSVREGIIQYYSENEPLRKALVKRFEDYRIAQNKLLSQKEITSLIKINDSKDGTVKRRSVVPGLIECTSNQVEGSELYLVEGKCLVGSTKVRLANGVVMSLEDIDRNLKSCQVLSWSGHSDDIIETDCKSVGIACYSKHNKRIYLKHLNGDDVKGFVECTPEHRFLYTNEYFEDWVTAEKLEEGDFLYGYSTSLSSLVISEIEDVYYEKSVPMYCLNVPETSNFILDYGGLVSHNSAAGPIARARNPKLQAVLPLRGKIKNVTGLSIKEALKSQEVCNIVNAIGGGLGDKADPKLSRYEKIILCSDSDVDGQHIASLILACLVNILPPIVKAGMVYLLEAPLYGYNLKGTKQRFYTSDITKVPKDALNFTRYKGLGEMDDNEFRDSCLFEGKRKLYRIEYPENLEWFNNVMGTSEGRSNLLSDLGIIKGFNNGEQEL